LQTGGTCTCLEKGWDYSPTLQTAGT